MLLLDDPLSAVDAIVCEKLFHEGILPFAEEKILVMALNQLHLLTHFDLVYVIEKGRIVDVGEPKALLKSKGAFFEMMKHERERSEIHNDDDSHDEEKTNDEEKVKENEDIADRKSFFIKKQKLVRGGFDSKIFKKYIKGMGYLNTLLAVTTTFSACTYNCIHVLISSMNSTLLYTLYLPHLQTE